MENSHVAIMLCSLPIAVCVFHTIWHTNTRLTSAFDSPVYLQKTEQTSFQSVNLLKLEGHFKKVIPR